MAGQIHALIERIVSERAKGDPALVSTTKTKLILKGINPDKFGPTSPDDPAVIAKLQTVAAELGVAA